MLTTRLRKQIEWHFYNFAADLAAYREKEQDILGGGLTMDLSRVGSGTGGGDPTESKALRLIEWEGDRTWFTVVRNTFTAFKFRDSYPVMRALYIRRRELKEILCDGLWETTFYRWRDEWLECAYKWAQEFGLL